MNKFKLVTLLGIRPDLIRMHKLLCLLDEGQKEHDYEHIFVHSGQHFDYELDEAFYKELEIRKPDLNLNIGRTLRKSGKTSVPYQLALLFEKVSEMVEEINPDAVMYLGDTNTVLSSVVVSRLGLPVIHIEGGGRSFDWRMPEEKNRIVIDHLSDMLYVYLERYKDLLLQEGIPPYRIKVVGNIIVDALESFSKLADRSKVMETLKVEEKKFILCTLHREENITSEEIFRAKINDLVKLSQEFPLIFPIMPRVQAKLDEYNLVHKIKKSNIIATKPLSFLDFLKLEKNAKAVITDSGTVQEECLLLGVPCLVSRRSTERPETIEAGATILSDDNLYENTLKVMEMKAEWNRAILNPSRQSPSEIIYTDLVEKIKSNFFNNSRNMEINSLDWRVTRARGINTLFFS